MSGVYNGTNFLNFTTLLHNGANKTLTEKETQELTEAMDNLLKSGELDTNKDGETTIDEVNAASETLAQTDAQLGQSFMSKLTKYMISINSTQSTPPTAIAAPTVVAAGAADADGVNAFSATQEVQDTKLNPKGAASLYTDTLLSEEEKFFEQLTNEYPKLLDSYVALYEKYSEAKNEADEVAQKINLCDTVLENMANLSVPSKKGSDEYNAILELKSQLEEELKPLKEKEEDLYRGVKELDRRCRELNSRLTSYSQTLFGNAGTELLNYKGDSTFINDHKIYYNYKAYTYQDYANLTKEYTDTWSSSLINNILTFLSNVSTQYTEIANTLKYNSQYNTSKDMITFVNELYSLSGQYVMQGSNSNVAGMTWWNQEIAKYQKTMKQANSNQQEAQKDSETAGKNRNAALKEIGSSSTGNLYNFNYWLKTLNSTMQSGLKDTAPDYKPFSSKGIVRSLKMATNTAGIKCNGKIDGDIQQKGNGDCWIISTVKVSKKQVSACISEPYCGPLSDEPDRVQVKLGTKQFVVTYEEIATYKNLKISANYYAAASGDDDLLAFELALSKYFNGAYFDIHMMLACEKGINGGYPLAIMTLIAGHDVFSDNPHAFTSQIKNSIASTSMTTCELFEGNDKISEAEWDALIEKCKHSENSIVMAANAHAVSVESIQKIQTTSGVDYIITYRNTDDSMDEEIRTIKYSDIMQGTSTSNRLPIDQTKEPNKIYLRFEIITWNTYVPEIDIDYNLENVEYTLREEINEILDEHGNKVSKSSVFKVNSNGTETLAIETTQDSEGNVLKSLTFHANGNLAASTEYTYKDGGATAQTTYTDEDGKKTKTVEHSEGQILKTQIYGDDGETVVYETTLINGKELVTLEVKDGITYTYGYSDDGVLQTESFEKDNVKQVNNYDPTGTYIASNIKTYQNGDVATSTKHESGNGVSTHYIKVSANGVVLDETFYTNAAENGTERYATTREPDKTLKMSKRVGLNGNEVYVDYVKGTFTVKQNGKLITLSNSSIRKDGNVVDVNTLYEFANTKKSDGTYPTKLEINCKLSALLGENYKITSKDSTGNTVEQTYNEQGKRIIYKKTEKDGTVLDETHYTNANNNANERISNQRNSDGTLIYTLKRDANNNVLVKVDYQNAQLSILVGNNIVKVDNSLLQNLKNPLTDEQIDELYKYANENQTNKTLLNRKLGEILGSKKYGAVTTKLSGSNYEGTKNTNHDGSFVQNITYYTDSSKEKVSYKLKQEFNANGKRYLYEKSSADGVVLDRTQYLDPNADSNNRIATTRKADGSLIMSKKVGSDNQNQIYIDYAKKTVAINCNGLNTTLKCSELDVKGNEVNMWNLFQFINQVPCPTEEQIKAKIEELLKA